MKMSRVWVSTGSRIRCCGNFSCVPDLRVVGCVCLGVMGTTEISVGDGVEVSGFYAEPKNSFALTFGNY